VVIFVGVVELGDAGLFVEGRPHRSWSNQSCGVLSAVIFLVFFVVLVLVVGRFVVGRHHCSRLDRSYGVLPAVVFHSVFVVRVLVAGRFVVGLLHCS